MAACLDAGVRHRNWNLRMAHMPLQDSLEMPVGSNYLRFHLTLSFGALLGIGAGRLPTTGGPRDRNGARRFGRDLGRNAAEQVAEQRALSRSDYDVVDMVGLREFEDCVCRIDCFEHVDAETMGFELERLGPVPERDEPVDALVMTLLIERGIKRDPSQLENVQTGEPRSGKRRQNALARGSKGVVDFARCFPEIDRDRDNRGRRNAGGGRRASERSRQILVETSSQNRAQRIALQSLGSLGEFDLVAVTQIERQLGGGRVAPGRLDLEAAQDDFLKPRRIIRPQSPRRNGIAPKPSAHSTQGLAFAERPNAC